MLRREEYRIVQLFDTNGVICVIISRHLGQSGCQLTNTGRQPGRCNYRVLISETTLVKPVVTEHPAISFIIPALNEEASILATMDSIRDHVPSELCYEIIVADNGSTDETAALARSRKARVLIDCKATVGGLRNRAAGVASGQVLVFLDADIELTQAWTQGFPGVFESLIDNPLQVTGSRCGIPEQASLIERYWFSPLLNKQGNYVNSGHLITTRELFNRIGGFDESLETGEDYAFGLSALSVRATVINNPLLAVIHKGYPRTLLQFVRRESWHGRGDCRSLKAVAKSKVASLSIAFSLLQLVTLASFFLFPGGIAGMMGLLLVVGICIAAAVTRHNAKSPVSLLVVGILYYCYFMARFISCVLVQCQDMLGKEFAG